MQIRVSGGNCLCCPKNSKRDLGAVVVRDRNVSGSVQDEPDDAEVWPAKRR